MPILSARAFFPLPPISSFAPSRSSASIASIHQPGNMIPFLASSLSEIFDAQAF
jgi:hypothetical protein